MMLEALGVLDVATGTGLIADILYRWLYVQPW
jgi:hypothetical protein